MARGKFYQTSEAVAARIAEQEVEAARVTAQRLADEARAKAALVKAQAEAYQTWRLRLGLRDVVFLEDGVEFGNHAGQLRADQEPRMRALVASFNFVPTKPEFSAMLAGIRDGKTNAQIAEGVVSSREPVTT